MLTFEKYILYYLDNPLSNFLNFTQITEGACPSTQSPQAGKQLQPLTVG